MCDFCLGSGVLLPQYVDPLSGTLLCPCKDNVSGLSDAVGLDPSGSRTTPGQPQSGVQSGQSGSGTQPV